MVSFSLSAEAWSFCISSSVSLTGSLPCTPFGPTMASVLIHTSSNPYSPCIMVETVTMELYAESSMLHNLHTETVTA